MSDNLKHAQVVTDWSKLSSGRFREEVFITTDLVPGVGNFLYRTNVKHNWYRCSNRIIFENGKSLNTRDQTIDRRRVYIFIVRENAGLELLWIRHENERKRAFRIKEIRNLLHACPPDVVCILEPYVSEEACLAPAYTTCFPKHAADVILLRLELLGLKQLRQIAFMLNKALQPPPEPVAGTA
jgi:hypothetical protein